MPLELLEILRDSDINPKEVLNYQVKFVIGSNKSEDQKTTIRNFIDSFNL